MGERRAANKGTLGGMQVTNQTPGEPAWWERLHLGSTPAGYRRGGRCERCRKGRIYDHNGVWCNRCGRIANAQKEAVAPDVWRHSGNALYLPILKATHLEDAAVQALVHGSDGRLSDRRVKAALGARRETAVQRLEAAIAEVPWLRLREGKQGVRSRQIVVVRRYVPAKVLNTLALSCDANGEQWRVR